VDLEEEAVELGLGERVGALLLEGVLRRHHEEGLRERVAHTPHRHGPLLHRFEQRGLRLGRGAVDLVGQQHLREDRPAFHVSGEVGEAVVHRGRVLQSVALK
jgi:hypothetical protein